MSEHYKIISDGTFHNVKIIAPNGEDISSKVSEYSIVHSAGEKPKLYIRWAIQEVGTAEFSSEIESGETTEYPLKQGEGFSAK